MPGAVVRDGALLLLAVVTLAAAAYVLAGGPSPATSEQTAPAPAPSELLADPAEVSALFVGSDGALGGPRDALATQAAAALDWQARVALIPGGGYLAGPQGTPYADRIAELVAEEPVDVVVVVSSSSPEQEADPRRLGGNAQAVVAAIREARPQAQIILVGPLAAEPEAAPQQRAVLTQVAARFGVVLVDPIGRGYLAGPDLVDEAGLPTAEGAAEAGRRLAEDLRVVLPDPLVDGPA